jgi:sortase A
VSDVAEPTAKPGRVRKFDRPPPPHDWRWWVGGLGKTLIAAGLLMFGFVAYQLWGTGIETARAQSALENEFEDLLAGRTTTDAPVITVPDSVLDTVAGTAPDTIPDTVPGTIPDTVPASAPEAAPIAVPTVEEGDPIARIEMPAIGVDNIVVAGVEKSDLKKGPGHYPETPMPGQLGNAAIAGHRTTYGQPFFNVDKLEVGDEIVVTTLDGRYVYRVTGQQIVSPSDYQVVATTDPTTATLTLTSCHPKYTARERIIITSELDTAASSGPVGEPVINYGRPIDEAGGEPDPTNTVAESVPTDSTSTSEPAVAGIDDDPSTVAQAGSDAVNAEIADAFADGWFSDPNANGQVAIWGLLLAAIGLVSYLVSKKAKRDWVGLTVGIVPFVIVLYFFFQNVNRLLPPNL